LADFSKDLKISEPRLVKNIWVGFGRKVEIEISTQNKLNFRSVKSFAIHPEYNAGSIATVGSQPMYDIALLKLSELAPSTSKPAFLPADRLALVHGQWVRLVGFGLVNGESNQRAKHMMEADVTIDNPEFSRTQFTYISQAGKGSCSGDSGGPAYYITKGGELVVLGVTSWGDRKCQGTGAYTSVPYFLEWIKATVHQL
jgi:hypothetical protein